MDLMESDAFHPPTILLQTVLEEVRHRSLPLYSRLKALTKAEDKNIWIFYNEFRECASENQTFKDKSLFYLRTLIRETAIGRQEGESPNDRNDRSIRRAAAWYATHMQEIHPRTRSQSNPALPAVVMMTNDAGNRRRAMEDGIASITGMLYSSKLGTHVKSELTIL